MTTMEQFNDALRVAGFALTRTPGGFDVCRVSSVDRVVYIGADVTDDAMVAVIGLHELGHVLAPNRDRFLMCDLNQMNYGNELAAWTWAEQWIADEDRALFEEIRGWALNTYRADFE